MWAITNDYKSQNSVGQKIWNKKIPDGIMLSMKHDNEYLQYYDTNLH